MSDRQLKDMGLVRSQIAFAVKNGIGREPTMAFFR
jgi:uncharacterized protein YjiS (DUF1127 family)